MNSDAPAELNPTAQWVIVDVDVEFDCGKLIWLTGLALPVDVDTDHPAVDLVTEILVYPV